jgi:hypothetical protein
MQGAERPTLAGRQSEKYQARKKCLPVDNFTHMWRRDPKRIFINFGVLLVILMTSSLEQVLALIGSGVFVR